MVAADVSFSLNLALGSHLNLAGQFPFDP
jgi:hypothetical protein